jgi:Ca-activated chloride channel family protein
MGEVPAMIFRDARWLWLLAALPLALLFLVARERLRERLARRFVAERLRGVTNAIRWLRPWLIGFALALGVVAIAGPSIGFVTLPFTDREANRVIAIDVSNSMLAQDAGTSRLAAAKAIAKRLIDSWDGRVALVVFESRAEVVAPLTSDSEAIDALLESVIAGEIGDPGSDLSAALSVSMKLVEADPGSKADIVMISDGEDQGTRLQETLRRARSRNVMVSTIMIGSQQGSTIPTDNGELRDDAGNVVTTYAHPDTLQTIARSTGGFFLENPFSEHALDPLLVARAFGAAKQKTVRVPVDRYQWPLAAAFVLLFIGSIANRGAE